MQVCHVTMHFLPKVGGQETYIVNLNQIFNEVHYQTKVIQPRRSNLVDIKGEDVTFLPAGRFMQKFIVGWDWIWFNFMLCLRREQIMSMADVYISHYPFHYPALPSNVDIVVVSHGVDWPSHPKSLFDKFKQYAANKAVNNHIKIVANDTNFLRYVGLNVKPGVNYFKEVAPKIWFIPNCIDINKFHPSNKPRKKVIFVPRNIRRARGIHLAILAFSLLLKKHSNFELHIAGGPLHGHYFDECKKLIQDLGIDEAVAFLGNISENEMIEKYQTSMVTVIPTIDYEGTSLSSLESMACGTPVVATKVGGLIDLPNSLAEVNAISISEKINEVLENWEKEAIQQRKKTIETFNMKNWGDSWLRVLN
jgi:glycosyltransferase involved in cell wall biosynthesis